MKIQVLLLMFASALLTFSASVRGQVAEPHVIGPEYPIIKQLSEYQQKGNHYCGGYFVLEAGTQYGGPYLAFSYRDDKDAAAHDEASLNHVSIVVVPDPTVAGTQGLVPAGVMGLPRARLVRQDAGQNIWVISVTGKMLEDYQPCLKDISK